MNLEETKGIVLVTLFVLTALLTMLPLKVISAVRHTLNPELRRKYTRIISILNCVGGGVFLAAGLLDLFPEVRDDLSEIFDRLNVVSTFPIAEFIMVFGFFVAFIVEQIVLSIKENSNDSVETRPLLFRRHSVTTYRSIGEETAPHHHHHNSHSHDVHEHHQSHSILHDIAGDGQSNLRSVVLLLALSLHSVFEGLAIGLQANTEELLQIFVAVVIHKSIIAFSLGLNLVQSNLPLKVTVLMNVVFSITAPIGIAIGMGIMGATQSIETDIVAAVLQGIACGTFLYVTFFEVLPHEMNDSKDRLLKVLGILFGYSIICGALFLDPSVERPSCYRGAQPLHKN